MDVHFIAVAMAFADLACAVDRGRMAVARKPRRKRAQPHRAAKIAARIAQLATARRFPFGDEADDRLCRGAELRCGRAFDARAARAFDAGHLHAKANAEERHLPLARAADAGDLAFGTAFAKTAELKSGEEGKSVSERVDTG